MESVEDSSLTANVMALPPGPSTSPDDGSVSHPSSPNTQSTTTHLSPVVVRNEGISTVGNITEPKDVQNCRKFVQRACKCNLVKPNGSPCSRLLALEEYIQTRAQSSFLDHDELDFTLMGFIECSALMQDDIINGRHSNPEKKSNHEVQTPWLRCLQETFVFLLSIGKTGSTV